MLESSKKKYYSIYKYQIIILQWFAVILKIKESKYTISAYHLLLDSVS